MVVPPAPASQLNVGDIGLNNFQRDQAFAGYEFEHAFNETWTFRHHGPPSELLAIFRSFYGPTMNAFEAAERDGRADQLQAELLDLFTAQNLGDETAAIPATYLKVTATRR